MSATVRIDENFFTCSICNDDYRDPRSLPCLHSFCRVCLFQHISYSAQREPPSFLCPVCRKTTPVPAEGRPIEGWADLFPANFWLKDLMSQASLQEDSRGPAAGSGEGPGNERRRCSVHPEQDVSMFCTACRVLVCNVCIVSKHIHCQFVSLDKKSEWERNDLRTCIDSLKSEIIATQKVNNELENELTYLSRQREKARVSIESHAAKFTLMLERAKRKLFSRLDTEYHEVKKDLDKQLSADNARLQFLKRLNIDAREFIQTESRPQGSSQAGEITRKINDAISSSSLERRPKFERMRASFAPDFSSLEKDLKLGTVAFYNSKVLAAEDAAPTLTRSQSSVQLRRKVSVDSLFRRESIPRPSSTHLGDQNLEQTGAVAEIQAAGGAGIEATNSRPVPRQRPFSVPNLDVDSSSLLGSRLGSMPSRNRSHDSLDTNQRPSTIESPATPMFFIEETGPNIHEETRVEDEEETREEDKEEDEITMVKSQNQTSVSGGGTPLIPSRVISRVSLMSQEDGQVPDISSVTVLPDGQVMLADSANMSIKVVRNRSVCSAIKLDDRPCGIAAASPDRVLASLPISKGLVVVSTGSMPKVITKLHVQRSYRTLMSYRSGIVAAACGATCCIDLVTLQGKVMKQFSVGNHPVKDIAFCVDTKQELVLWESMTSSLISVSKTGVRATEGTCDLLKGKDVTSVALETSGLLYAMHDGKVAMVTRKGDHCGVLDNVFYCQCVCGKGSGAMFVVEAGGELKEIGF